MNPTFPILFYFAIFLARFFLYPLFFLGRIIRRRPDLWVFGSWGGYRFADNSAAFFLYCQREFANEVRLVWISRDAAIVSELGQRGYEAYRTWSLRGLWYCLRAKLYIFDSFSKDINFWTSCGAIKINLWSGVPIKAFERDITNRRSRYYRLFHGSLPERVLLGFMMPWHVQRPDLIIATASETARITARAFDLPRDSVVVTGFPRNDILFKNSDSAGKLTQTWSADFKKAVEAHRKIFMYLPTYRDSGTPFFDVDWSVLDQMMNDLNATFFFKFHPDEKFTFRGEGKYIIELDQEADIYSMMPCVDTLISDYSSIIFDYMLLERPIIYYTPDIEEFTASSRSLIFEPEDIAVGTICLSADDLLAAISRTANGVPATPDQQAKWSAIRIRFNAHRDGQSSQRVADVIDDRVLQGYLRGSSVSTVDKSSAEA